MVWSFRQMRKISCQNCRLVCLVTDRAHARGTSDSFTSRPFWPLTIAGMLGVPVTKDEFKLSLCPVSEGPYSDFMKAQQLSDCAI